jgi:hypothetical protein
MYKYVHVLKTGRHCRKLNTKLHTFYCGLVFDTDVGIRHLIYLLVSYWQLRWTPGCPFWWTFFQPMYYRLFVSFKASEWLKLVQCYNMIRIILQCWVTSIMLTCNCGSIYTGNVRLFGRAVAPAALRCHYTPSAFCCERARNASGKLTDAFV